MLKKTYAIIISTLTLMYAIHLHATELTYSADTLRMLEWIEKDRPKITAAGRKAAYRLNKDGDIAYKRGDYNTAYTAYYNSYPNSPNPHAYVMAGDSHLRGVLKYQESRPLEKGEQCRISNGDFINRLETGVDEHQSLGLILAERTNDQKFLASELYKRTRESTACLKALIIEYNAKPKESCIDLEQLKKCLGKPFLE